jgi:hypothetical protein
VKANILSVKFCNTVGFAVVAVVVVVGEVVVVDEEVEDANITEGVAAAVVASVLLSCNTVC